MADCVAEWYICKDWFFMVYAYTTSLLLERNGVKLPAVFLLTQSFLEHDHRGSKALETLHTITVGNLQVSNLH